MQTNKFSTIWIVGLIFLLFSCRDSWVEKWQSEVNYTLSSTILFPIATPESKTIVSTAQEVSASYSGSTYQCATKTIKFTKPIESIVLAGLDDTHTQAYPGAVVQLKSLHDQGTYQPVEQFARGNMTLKSSIVGTLPRKINLLNEGKVKLAVQDPCWAGFVIPSYFTLDL